MTQQQAEPASYPCRHGKPPARCEIHRRTIIGKLGDHQRERAAFERFFHRP